VVYVPRVNGIARVGFERGTLDRASVAWSPDDGKCYQENVPRIVKNRIPILNASPRLFYTFPDTEAYLGYAQNLPVGCTTWCTGAGGRLTQFKIDYPEFDEINLGQSFEGRDLFAYRLTQNGWVGDPWATKHFWVYCVVHGNEVDGLNGVFKAMEILARNGAFQAFRDEWSILFVPFFNPDGWCIKQRNLMQVGPNGNTVNLNRQADWFWAEYVEESSESKGAAPWSSPEATAMIGLYNQIIAAGGSVGVVLDMHATEGGGGARYMTRDRLLQHITETQGVSTSIPNGYLTLRLDYYIRQFSRAHAIKRFVEQGSPDLFMRLIRSRYEPKLHSYFSSKGCFSTVVEEAKVSTSPVGTVSYQSACNFRLDHILSVAICCTAANWSYDDALLIEKGTTNLLSNASFEQWQGASSVGLSTQYSDTFTTPNSNWSMSGFTQSGNLTTVPATDAYAELSIIPLSIEQKVQCSISLDGAGAIVEFYIAARSYINPDTQVFTTGYRIRFEHATLNWTLERVNAGVVTVLATLASTTYTRPTTNYRVVYFRTRYANPVELYAVMNGRVIFDTSDATPSKIVDENYASFGARGNTTQLKIDSFSLQTEAKEERPGWYNAVRGSISRSTVREGEKFFDDLGEGLKFTAAVDAMLSQGSEFCAGVLTNLLEDGSSVGVVTSYDSFYFMSKLEYKTTDAIPPGFFVHPNPVGAAIFGQGSTTTMMVVGGGSANFTGASSDHTSVIISSTGAYVQTYLGALTGMPTLMHMGFCENTFKFLDLIVDGTWRGYMFGGMDAAGAYQKSILIYDFATVTTSAQELPKALIGCVAVYNRNDDCCYIFGGMSSGGPVTDIYKYDCALDVLTDLTATVALPVAVAYTAATIRMGTGLVGDERIYIFGGEEASGDMSSAIYSFDPVLLTIVAESFTQNVSDAEGDDSEGGGAWDKKIGRWNAVTKLNSYDDYGIGVLIGGRQDTNAGALLDTIYTVNFIDRTINLFRSSEYGYVRYSTAYSLKFETVTSLTVDLMTDLGPGWSDPNSNWIVASNYASSSIVGGPAICLAVPAYINQRVTLNMFANPTPDYVSLILRGTWIGAALQSGYELVYHFATKTWHIKRYNAGVATTIYSYDVTGSPSRQIVAATKTVMFRAMFRDPVEFYAYVISSTTTYTLFSTAATFDYDPDRITDVGLVAFAGKSATGAVGVDNFLLEVGGHNEERFTCSAHAKSDSLNVSGYYRFSLMPGSAIDSVWCTRYCSQYYLVPPSVDYYWARGRADLRNGLSDKREDQIRIFHRTHKELQTNYFDGLHLAKGTLIPSSYHMEGLTRADEEFTFADVLNPNCFQISFNFVPTFYFNDLDDADLELFRISIDANNYILCSAISTSGHARWIREYYQNSIDGQHDPIIRLIKVRGGATVASMDMVCYFGAATMADNDPVNEACEDQLKFTVTNHAGLFEFRVNHWGSEGIKMDNADLTPFASQAASVKYSGVGYFTEPKILDVVQDASGRQLPARRKGVVERLQGKRRHALLSGDRDPTNGVVAGQPYYQNAGMTFGLYDNFTRVDAASLGSKWLEDTSYYGWRIVSNQAMVSASLGYHRGYANMAFPPRHADIRIVSNFIIFGNTAYFGLRSRFGCPLDVLNATMRPKSYNADVFGYEVLIEQVTASSALLGLYRHHRTHVVLLDSAALSSFTQGESLEMTFDLQGTSLTAAITGRASVSATDDIHRRPRNTGIVGHGDSADYAIVKDFAVYANFDNVGE